MLGGCTARFVYDLIGNSEDRFSHDAAHIISVFPCLIINAIFCFDAHKQNKTINISIYLSILQHPLKSIMCSRAVSARIKARF